MLKPDNDFQIPEDTVKVAKAAFPNGNIYLTLRDNPGPIFEDALFKNLYPALGQPAASPGRLALITIKQYLDDLPDRQAAEAVRSRIDWTYMLGLRLDDPGFNYSVLSEFRQRLLEGKAAEHPILPSDLIKPISSLVHSEKNVLVSRIWGAPLPYTRKKRI